MSNQYMMKQYLEAAEDGIADMLKLPTEVQEASFKRRRLYLQIAQVYATARCAEVAEESASKHWDGMDQIHNRLVEIRNALDVLATKS